MMAMYIELRNAQSGELRRFSQQEVLWGRDGSCDLVFADCRRVSRRQAALLCGNGAWYIRDLNSTNGTFVNGERLNPGEVKVLRIGDKICLGGEVNLTVTAIGTEAPAPRQAADWDAEAQWDGPVLSDRVWDCPASSPTVYGECALAPEYDRPAPACPAPPPVPARPTPPPAPAAQERKKTGVFERLFGRKKNAAPPPSPEKPASDTIQFRAAAPGNINPGEFFIVKIMLCLDGDYQRADREAAVLGDQLAKAAGGVIRADRGQAFRIVLQSPDADLGCESETVFWNGSYASADFEAFLPKDFALRQLRIRGRVYAGDAVVTDLKLILRVGDRRAQEVVCEKVKLRSAFISYASADRARVVARIQGIMLACPDMDLFFDVESLRRGENWESRLYLEIAKRDLFYLFWSQNAAASEWVSKELEYAVTNKSMDYIEPIPLEGPEVCPPPRSLMGKHFNDWTLRYLNNQ